APGMSIAVLGVLARLLPEADGADPGELAEPGWLHRRGVARGPLLALGNRAARRNLEVPWASPEPGCGGQVRDLHPLVRLLLVAAVVIGLYHTIAREKMFDPLRRACDRRSPWP